VFIFFIAGQQRADGVDFIPRTDQNAKRVQQRMSAIQRLKYSMSQQMEQNGWKQNGRKQNNMQANGMRSNGMGRGNGMRFNNMRFNRMGRGNRNGGMFQDAFSYNVPSQMNSMNMHGYMGTGYMNPEHLEAMMDYGGMGMMNGGVAMINVETMRNRGMGMNQGGMTGNNGGMGMRRRGRNKKMKLPMCQPIHECAERFIPPQCRSSKFDTMNNVMCLSCPINRCEGGAKEYFNTMYEYHPSRIMISMMS
jgi:hypothetical protein